MEELATMLVKEVFSERNLKYIVFEKGENTVFGKPFGSYGID